MASGKRNYSVWSSFWNIFNPNRNSEYSESANLLISSNPSKKLFVGDVGVDEDLDEDLDDIEVDVGEDVELTELNDTEFDSINNLPENIPINNETVTNVLNNSCNISLILKIAKTAHGKFFENQIWDLLVSPSKPKQSHTAPHDISKELNKLGGYISNISVKSTKTTSVYFSDASIFLDGLFNKTPLIAVIVKYKETKFSKDPYEIIVLNLNTPNNKNTTSPIEILLGQSIFSGVNFPFYPDIPSNKPFVEIFKHTIAKIKEQISKNRLVNDKATISQIRNINKWLEVNKAAMRLTYKLANEIKPRPSRLQIRLININKLVKSHPELLSTETCYASMPLTSYMKEMPPPPTSSIQQLIMPPQPPPPTSSIQQLIMPPQPPPPSSSIQQSIMPLPSSSSSTSTSSSTSSMTAGNTKKRSKKQRSKKHKK